MAIDTEIQKAFEALTDTQQQLLIRIIGSFEAGVEVTVNPDSDLCSDQLFVDYFADLFSVYHSITEYKFEKKSFEFGFKYACIAAGYVSEITDNPAHPGEDVTRGDQKISLKTEGGDAEGSFTISKFSEGRFIAKYKTEQEEERIKALALNDPTRKQQLTELVELRSTKYLPELLQEFKNTLKHHLGNYDRIIGLKSRPIEIDGEVAFFRYRLIEIPMGLLKIAFDLTPEDCKPLKGNGGTSAVAKIDGKRVFGVILDGSVEKVRITSIKIDKCITHAEFIVPISIT